MDEVLHRQTSQTTLFDDIDKLDPDGETESLTSLASKRKEVEHVERLARSETRSVRAWRLVVLCMILITGALVSAGTYIFLKKQDEDDIRTNYFLFTNSMEETCSFQIKNMYLAFRSMSEVITSDAMFTGQTFPFVTIPNFEVHGEHTRKLSGVEMFAFTPILKDEQLDEWLEYSQEHQFWINISRATILGNEGLLDDTHYLHEPICPFIYVRDEHYQRVPTQPPYIPLWQLSPPPFSPQFINYDGYKEPAVQEPTRVMMLVRDGIMTPVLPQLDRLTGVGVNSEDHFQFHLQFMDQLEPDQVFLHPHSLFMSPVFQTLNDPTANIVGLLVAIVPWGRYVGSLLPSGVRGAIAVLQNTCGQSFSYEVNGPKAVYLGQGDAHDVAFDDTKVTIPLHDFLQPSTLEVPGHCIYSFDIYSSSTYEDNSRSSLPIIVTAGVATIFVVMAITFSMYDRFVYRRNVKVVNVAARSNSILSSLFPSNVRDRLFAEDDETTHESHLLNVPKNRLRTFLNNEDANDHATFEQEKPIADLFSDTTVMFADVVGFTAWSSVREPAQVFLLLETLFRAFDKLAQRRRVFKVETVGDCYVAVAGLPDPRADHAVAMTRFACDCLRKMRSLTKDMEVVLGPDTAELSMRFGLHSGPVTAGVLRGERSRFQLFGDTMNTAARMESNGQPGKIHISQETADLLIAAGKKCWIKKREDKVYAKGKGEMQTFWIISEGHHKQYSEREEDDFSAWQNPELPCHRRATHDIIDTLASPKTTRLIEWNVDVLMRLLKAIVARRNNAGILPSNCTTAQWKREVAGQTAEPTDGAMMPIDEVCETITLPEFNPKTATDGHVDPDSIELRPEVVEQLHDYVSNIAAMYRDNAFHNFEHASHVTMSVVKLLSRIVAPTDEMFASADAQGTSARGCGKTEIASTLHDHTYGITSDALTQFACVFSALIHDIDHAGVPNSQLVKENAAIAAHYRNKSVAEQNAVDLAWDVLMDDRYALLRAAIYSSDSELKRFRQLVVNCVMATDIVDKELKTLRNLRWNRAFTGDHAKAGDSTSLTDDINRKATVVIEHLLMASDVAHTMQHWHVYCKWNRRYYLECYAAYRQGRAERDPAEYWYEGELGFFDFYILPLAKKLKDCGVFGVSSDEYLTYAEQNRREWEARGRDVVDEMIETAKTEVRQSRFD